MPTNSSPTSSETSQITADLVATINRVAQGNRGAIEEVYGWCYPGLIATARRLRVKPEAIGSVTSEAFGSCIRHIRNGTIRDVSHLIRHARECIVQSASNGSSGMVDLLMAQEEERSRILWACFSSMHPEQLEDLRRYYLDEARAIVRKEL
jgi:hypothetical protein